MKKESKSSEIVHHIPAIPFQFGEVYFPDVDGKEGYEASEAAHKALIKHAELYGDASLNHILRAIRELRRRQLTGTAPPGFVRVPAWRTYNRPPSWAGVLISGIDETGKVADPLILTYMEEVPMFIHPLVGYFDSKDRQTVIEHLKLQFPDSPPNQFNRDLVELFISNGSSLTSGIFAQPTTKTDARQTSDIAVVVADTATEDMAYQSIKTRHPNIETQNSIDRLASHYSSKRDRRKLIRKAFESIALGGNGIVLQKQAGGLSRPTEKELADFLSDLEASQRKGVPLQTFADLQGKARSTVHKWKSYTESSGI